MRVSGSGGAFFFLVGLYDVLLDILMVVVYLVAYYSCLSTAYQSETITVQL